MKSIRIPTIPNSPLKSAEDFQQFGFMRLRYNPRLNFIENAEFNSSRATYDDNYQNSQAHSPHFLRHMESVLELLKNEFPKGSRVVEVGCGKGSFVELMEADGYFKVSGYDETYEGANPLIHKRFLHRTDQISADVIVLRHVLEHIQEPHKFLAMLQGIFGSGKIYIEVPNFDWISENQAFFDITYEHVNYFSQHSLRALFADNAAKYGFCFGDQYQYIIAELNSLSDSFISDYESKDWKDLDFDTLFPNISEKIASIIDRLGEGSKLFIWGAATKGCMFLVHCATRNTLLDRVAFAIDVNPDKCGKFLPGSLVSIRGKEDFFRAVKRDDLLLIANPNYRDEILVELKQHGLGDLQVVTL